MRDSLKMMLFYSLVFILLFEAPNQSRFVYDKLNTYFFIETDFFYHVDFFWKKYFLLNLPLYYFRIGESIKMIFTLYVCFQKYHNIGIFFKLIDICVQAYKSQIFCYQIEFDVINILDFKKHDIYKNDTSNCDDLKLKNLNHMNF